MDELLKNYKEYLPDYGEEILPDASKTVGLYGGKFFPPHIGHLQNALESSKLVDVLYVAVQYDEVYERKLIEGTSFEYVSPGQRVRWMTEMFKYYPSIRVIGMYERRSDEHMTDPLLGAIYTRLKEIVGGKIDYVFSNTHDYDEYFAKWLPGVKHIVGKDEISISATSIREEGVFAHWGFLPEAVQKSYLKKIAILGWESSGKTYTTRKLAKTFSTKHLEEYGREYFDELGGFTSVVTPSDFFNIAVGHLSRLQNITGNRVFFIDTDLVYTQFYYKQTYGELDPILDKLIREDKEGISLRIFLDPFNTLEDDGTRFRLDDTARWELSEELKALYEYYGKEVVVISEADNALRFAKCVEVVKNFAD